MPKCLFRYQWVKLPRVHLPVGKGIMGYWAKLASRAAFRKGRAKYCGYTNDVMPGMWSGGVVGLKSILGVKSRTEALEIMDTLSRFGYIRYTLDEKTKKLEYVVTDWVVKCSGAECMSGAVYATDGYGFLCLPRNITQRLADQHYTFGESDAWLDLWCHTVWQETGNAFSYLAPAVQFGRLGAALTLEALGRRWGWEKTKVWRFFQKNGDAFALHRLPGSYGCLVFNRLYPLDILNNQTITSFIRVEKRDAETGKIIPAAGIGFQVRDLTSGELISQTVYYPVPVTISTFYTADDGTLMLPCELPYGRYELIEVTTCHGYVLDTAPVPFTVDGSEAVVTVTKSNMAQKGVIRIQKTGEVFSSVVNEGSIFRPVYENTGLPGAVFDIAAAEDIYTPDGTLRAKAGDIVDTVTTQSDGTAASKALYLGKYVITEKQAPHGMALQAEAHTVELVYAGQEVTVTELRADMYNERQRVEISLVKTMETDKLFGLGQRDELTHVTFGLYAAEKLVAADGSSIPQDGLIEMVSLNKDGKATCKTDLPFGHFYLQEISTDSHYQLGDTKYPVSFDYAGQDKKLVKLIANEGAAIENKLIYGSVSGLKVDANDKPLSGAVMGLFAASETRFTKDTVLLTAVSAEDGRFRFEKIPAGNWFVREIEQPKGFVLSDELFPVTVKEQGQVIEIKIANKLIRGSVTLTKYDADYPENKLSGAVFEVYRDVNGNKALDKDDVLLGTMEESSAGVYWMKNLEYGGVLVREKTAPEGFIPDEKAYYVEIDTDGKTYTVENEAGKGFINRALKGSLKIIKTTSDGKKEGFAFRITGANGYDMTFTADAKGEIFIEKLRIGEYTVTELKNSASEGYKIADPIKITLVANETLTVKIHNDKTKVDVPKTGDDADLMLWISLLGLAAAGVGCTAFFYLKKRRTGKHIAVKK